MFIDEERYYWDHSKPAGDDLIEAVKEALLEFNAHTSPYVVRIYDTETRKCVFRLEK